MQLQPPAVMQNPSDSDPLLHNQEEEDGSPGSSGEIKNEEEDVDFVAAAAAAAVVVVVAAAAAAVVAVQLVVSPFVVVDSLKSDVQSAIRDNKIRVGDFYGYVEVTDKIKISAKNARNVVRALIDNEDNHKNGRRKKQVGESGHQILQSFSSLFGENLFSSNSTKVRENVKQEAVDRTLDQTRGSGNVPLVEDRALNLVDDRMGNSKLDLDTSQDSSTNSVLDMNKNGSIRTTPEGENVGLGDIRRSLVPKLKSLLLLSIK